jgi:hypothetical protein
MRIFVVIFSLSKQIMAQNLKSSHSRFLPIHYSLNILSLHATQSEPETGHK